MRKRLRLILKIKYLLMALTILLLGSIVLTFAMGGNMSTYKSGVLTLMSPLRSATSAVTGYFNDKEQEKQDKEALEARIEELEKRNSELMMRLENYQSDIYELHKLKKLLELKDTYSDYPTLGASVIAKNSGNWFYEFTIDKGADDGIELDMNVIADGGLAGIVTKVGSNSSVVTSILADDMNVSAISSTTRDTCIVSGDLELLPEGVIRVMYIHKDAKIKELDRLVTSSTSNKYLPHILIGYVKDITVDNNDLTQSAYLVPAVDFDHLEHVLVIMETKKG